MLKCHDFIKQFFVFIFQKMNLTIINMMKVDFDECSDNKHLKLKNLIDTQEIEVNQQEIRKLYVSTSSSVFDIRKLQIHFTCT